jgi:hypothetical protein
MTERTNPSGFWANRFPRDHESSSPADLTDSAFNPGSKGVRRVVVSAAREQDHTVRQVSREISWDQWGLEEASELFFARLAVAFKKSARGRLRRSGSR